MNEQCNQDNKKKKRNTKTKIQYYTSLSHTNGYVPTFLRFYSHRTSAHNYTILHLIKQK